MEKQIYAFICRAVLNAKNDTNLKDTTALKWAEEEANVLHYRDVWEGNTYCWWPASEEGGCEEDEGGEKGEH